MSSTMIQQPHRLLIPRPARDLTNRSLALDPSKTYFLQTLGPNVGICCMLGLFWRSVTIARILGGCVICPQAAVGIFGHNG